MTPNVINNEQAAEILAGLKAPKITIEYMESRIRNEEFIYPDSAPTLTICLITLDNGFHAVGISAPASTENFNIELGKKYARDNAIRDLWGKFGFALSEKRHAAVAGSALAGIEVRDMAAEALLANQTNAGLVGAALMRGDNEVAKPEGINTSKL